MADSGTGYGRAPSAYLRALTEVGPGTPMGELMRRYWHPVGLAADAGDTPRPVRVLGEDLILFGDGQGRPGLVHARCAHRGTTLYYGKVEARGIRCCYHGWLFDVEGHCLEQPCEPDGGRHRGLVRQPWYAVQERYGLLFAYMGPPERKPVLPRYDALEELDAGEFIDADDTSIGSGGAAVVPCNWLQHFENVMDPFHVPILHGTFSGPQFTEAMSRMPTVTWDVTERGVKSLQVRALEGGQVMHRVTEVVLPTLRVVANPYVGAWSRVESLGWTLPIDDTHYRIYTAGRVRERGAFLPRGAGAATGRKRWADMTEDERRRAPGDWEAQVGQGAITLHSEEHLETSDKGVVMVRKAFEAQLATLAAGRDPINVSFDPAAPPVKLEAGNFLLDA
jgi:nitrite reductase/ring-hydroxylating ferredoxin subunit